MSTIVDEIVEHGGGPGRLTVVAADGEVAATDWAEVHQRASRIAAVLIEERLGPGCRIGLGSQGVTLVPLYFDIRLDR